MRFLLVCLALMFAATAALAQGSYQIQPGDRLQVIVVEDSTYNTNALVGPDGNISVPGAGAVRVVGLSTVAAERVIRGRLAPQFQQPPTVSVGLSGLGNPNTLTPLFDIYVVGEVSNPGELQVKPGTTILRALAMAGGVSQFAATKRIQLRRVGASGRDSITLFNYRAVERGAQINRHIHLQPGDVIVVPERGLFE